MITLAVQITNRYEYSVETKSRSLLDTLSFLYRVFMLWSHFYNAVFKVSVLHLRQALDDIILLKTGLGFRRDPSLR